MENDLSKKRGIIESLRTGIYEVNGRCIRILYPFLALIPLSVAENEFKMGNQEKGAIALVASLFLSVIGTFQLLEIGKTLRETNLTLNPNQQVINSPTGGRIDSNSVYLSRISIKN